MKEIYLAPEKLKKDLQICLNSIEKNQQQIFKAMMLAKHKILTVNTLKEKCELSQLALNYQSILNENRKKLRRLIQNF